MSKPFSKLSQRNIDFIKLVVRSPNVGEGWREVSRMLQTAAKREVNAHPELYDDDLADGMRLRLSARGQVVADYL